jgi:hypothetical protein
LEQQREIRVRLVNTAGDVIGEGQIEPVALGTCPG